MAIKWEADYHSGPTKLASSLLVFLALSPVELAYYSIGIEPALAVESRHFSPSLVWFHFGSLIERERESLGSEERVQSRVTTNK